MTVNDQPLVIIVNYNGGRFLRTCVCSAFRQDGAVAGVLVVDNSSTDGSADCIIDDRLRIIRAATNLGYAAGVNLGLQEARALGARFVLVANCDVRLSETCVRELVTALMGHRTAWIAGPTLAEYPGVVTGDDEVREGGAAPSVVEWLSGAVMLFDLKRLGPHAKLDENFFLYYEENDLFLRVRRAGGSILLVPTAVAYHFGGGTTSASRGIAPYYTARSIILFVRKHMGAESRRSRLKFTASRFRVHFLMRGVLHPLVFFYAARGLVDGLRGRTGPRVTRSARRLRRR